MFTAVVRVTGTGRLEDFRERLRWLMVRDADAEAYTEHHGQGVLEYRFTPKKGIPFPAFAEASADFPELRVEAEWERDGERGRAVIEYGRLAEQASKASSAPGHEVRLSGDARLELAMACRREGDAVIGYAASADDHTYFRFANGELSLVDSDDADEALEDLAFAFVEDWIWYDEEHGEQAALERARYADYGYPVRGANLKSAKLALLRQAGAQSQSSLDAPACAARDALIARWLKKA
jgi:hypothetical protein